MRAAKEQVKWAKSQTEKRRGRQKMEAKCFRGRQLEVSVSHHGCLTHAFHIKCGKENSCREH